jgi:hypothetical protein
MKKRVVITGVAILVYNLFYPKAIRVLDEFDLSNGEWKLIKGYHSDSVQYVITDVSELERLKDEWVLSPTDRHFATTGGYNVELYKNGERVFYMDLIIDSKEDRVKSGILYHSSRETLAFRNLLWLNKGNWQREVLKPD